MLHSAKLATQSSMFRRPAAHQLVNCVKRSSPGYADPSAGFITDCGALFNASALLLKGAKTPAAGPANIYLNY